MTRRRRLPFPRYRGVEAADFAGDWREHYLYLGNLLDYEPQFNNPRFLGLALSPAHDRDLQQDLYQPLPIPDDAVRKIQAQDVLEHLDPERIPPLLDEVFRVLAPGGRFRLSVPDYRSPVQRQRSVFDENGDVLADLMVGGSVAYDTTSGQRVVSFDHGGDAHVWFPTIDSVLDLVERSTMSRCAQIVPYHFFSSLEEFVCEPYPDEEMMVLRAPPLDDRAGGRPVSVVVDFIK